MVYVVAYLKAQPGKGKEIMSVAEPLISGTRKEKGCIFYELYQRLDVPDTLVFVETWQDREAMAAHPGKAHSKAFERATASLVAEGRVEVVHPDNIRVL